MGLNVSFVRSIPSRPSGRSYTPLSSGVFLQGPSWSNRGSFFFLAFPLFLSTFLFVDLFLHLPFFRARSHYLSLSLPHLSPFLLFCRACSLFPSYSPPPSFPHSRPLGNAIVAATLDTTKSPTIPISTLRTPKLASRLPIRPNMLLPLLAPPHPRLLPAFSVPCYYQPPSPSRNDGTTSGCRAEGRLGRKGKFLVRVQTHWRLLSCCRHVLRGTIGELRGKGRREATEDAAEDAMGLHPRGDEGTGMTER